MGCDYYIISDLHIDYYDTKGQNHHEVIQCGFERRYLWRPANPDDSDDVDEKSYDCQLKEEIDKVNARPEKILYLVGGWVKDAYQTRYAHLINRLSNLDRLVKVVKTTYARER